VAMVRGDGEKQWQVRDRWYRMENRPDMQVGLIAYTTSDDVRPAPENPVQINGSVDRDARTDMMLEVDWIRFARPALRGENDWYRQVRANPIADPGVSDAEVLHLLGD
jgi:subtilase family serine protease